MPLGEPHWWLTKDADDRARAFFEHHYSRIVRPEGNKPKLFVGPGQKLVLVTYDYDALFVWRRFIDDCINVATGKRQTGVNCAIFRNQSKIKASELIRQADAIADHCWPDQRHYTYVNADCVRSTNPGCCFKMAGWKSCGHTQKGLLILERCH